MDLEGSFMETRITRQVYSLFQDLWDKFLGFFKRFKKGIIIKEFTNGAKSKPFNVQHLRHYQTCYQTSGNRKGVVYMLTLQSELLPYVFCWSLGVYLRP